jgi:hypothetical protein
MGPTQHPPKRRTNQERSRRPAKGRRRRPRLRRCLLKGCKQCFRPRRPWARYCGDDCRSKARRWSRWKAQKRYRATRFGKEQRQAQSRRYRQRIRAQKRTNGWEREAARVITANFFRLFLRPAGLLRDVRPHPPFPAAAILLQGVPARAGACPGAGAALEGASGAVAGSLALRRDDALALREWAS